MLRMLGGEARDKTCTESSRRERGGHARVGKNFCGVTRRKESDARKANYSKGGGLIGFSWAQRGNGGKKSVVMNKKNLSHRLISSDDR